MTQLPAIDNPTIVPAAFIAMISIAISVRSALLVWRTVFPSNRMEPSSGAPTH